jgi:acetyl esterase/lipase
MKYLLAICFLACLLMQANQAGADAEDIAYGPDPSQRLDVCTPAQQAPHMPALVMIHGGGWVAGSRAGQAGPCRRFAAAGIVAVPIDYRLYEKTPHTAWPVQLNDVQLAMRWVRAHAGELGIDPDHICAEGDSAGAQLALLLGVLPRIAPGDMAQLLPGVSPQADCMISLSGPTDLVALATARPNYRGFLQGPVAAAPDRLHALELSASPALLAQRGAPPALLIHGFQDKPVPFAQAEEMRQVLGRLGTPAWLVTYEGGHELKGLSGPEIQDVWALFARFVLARRLPGAPREMSTGEAFQLEP